MSERDFKRAVIVKNRQLIGMLTEEAVKKAKRQIKTAVTKAP